MRQVFIIQPESSQNQTRDFGHELNRDPMCERAVLTPETAPMDLRENVKIKGTRRDARFLKDFPVDTRQIMRKVNRRIGEDGPEPVCVVIDRVDLTRRDKPLDLTLTVLGTKKNGKPGQGFITNKKGFFFEQEGNSSMNDHRMRG